MTSLFSNTMSPAKEGNSSLPRSSNLAKPPLRALYDLLIAPMEGVSTTFQRDALTLVVMFGLHPSRLTGPDALQRARGQTQAAGDGAGGGAVPHPLRLAERKLFQRVPV